VAAVEEVRGAAGAGALTTTARVACATSRGLDRPTWPGDTGSLLHGFLAWARSAAGEGQAQ
ncbi:hypothetical protein, partial [Saccharomonospora iraqiensis]|uniref:hypothetical protein n=1 Tax=Saccharomonospora iraqiensis TaxID=52698 RepID=UPI001F1B23A3